jgi:hypothetical protein
MHPPSQTQLESIELAHYRCFFREPARLDLRPLTLLFGRNSAGKSALLRALPILSRSVSPDAQSAWDVGGLDGPGRGAPFRSFPTRIRSTPRFGITLHWHTPEGPRSDELHIHQEPATRPAFVHGASPSLRGSSEGWYWQPDDQGSHRAYHRRSDDAETALAFRGLVPSEGVDSRLDAMRDRLETLHRSVEWLHGGRVSAPREVSLAGNLPRSVESDGTQAALRLVMLEDELMESVRRFYASDTIGRDLRIAPSTAGSRRLLLDRLRTSPLHVDLADTGEGMGKVLPILVAVAAAVRHQGPRLVAIEDPEVHLHDDAVRALAEHLATEATVGRDHARIILETHSRTFLLAVQNAVRLGRIQPDDVAIHWSELADDGHATLTRIHLNDGGFPRDRNLLRRAFREDGDLAAALTGLE